MSTVVYQGLQSCFEPQIIETTTLKLKVAASTSIEFARSVPCLLGSSAATDFHHKNTELRDPKCNSQEIGKRANFGGWSFLHESLSNSISGKESMEKQTNITPYVHPLAKKFSSKLSAESLELCTENLGSESGSDIMKNSNILSYDYSSVSAPISEYSSTGEQQRQLPPQFVESRNNNFKVTNDVVTRNFPPPLTTMSGSNAIRVRSHREGGRLIIKAVETPTRQTYLQAERSHGRLRLSFLNKDFDSEVTAEVKNEEDGTYEGDVDDEDFDPDDDQGEDSEEGEKDAKEEEKDGYNTIMRKDKDGNAFEVEVEMGNNIEKSQRLSRCKEGGNENEGLCNWKPKPCWVITS